MKKLIEFVKKHKKAFLIGTTLVVVTAAGIVIYRMRFSDAKSIEAAVEAATDALASEAVDAVIWVS